MKRTYVRPTMVGERFVANEYVAACGEGGTVYEFECNAPEGMLYYYPDSDGEINGKYTGNGLSIRAGSYHPCGAKHKANATDDFYDGFVDYNNNRKCDDGEGIIFWPGTGWWNYGHATKNLDMSKWETVKS